MLSYTVFPFVSLELAQPASPLRKAARVTRPLARVREPGCGELLTALYIEHRCKGPTSTVRVPGFARRVVLGSERCFHRGVGSCLRARRPPVAIRIAREKNNNNPSFVSPILVHIVQ